MRGLPIDWSDASPSPPRCSSHSRPSARAAGTGARCHPRGLVKRVHPHSCHGSTHSRLSVCAPSLAAQDRTDGFVGSSALLGSLSGSLSGALSGGLNGRLSGSLSGGLGGRLGGRLGKRRPPERSPHGSVVGRTLGEPRRHPSRPRAQRPARRPARAVLLAAAPSAAAASRRISQAASLRPSAWSAAGVFREGWAAACLAD